MTVYEQWKNKDMTVWRLSIVASTLAVLSGCTTVIYGDKDTEAQLRQFIAPPGKASVYICREPAFLYAGSMAPATPILNGRTLGTLTPNTFTHSVVEPGSYDIHIVRGWMDSGSGTLNFQAKAGQSEFIWIGKTGNGFGVLTVDFFPTRIDAEQCVRNADYAVSSDQHEH